MKGLLFCREFVNDSRTALRFVEPGRYKLQHLALSERPAWRPSGLTSPRQVLAHTPVPHLLAKGTVWQLRPETRNPEALKARFLATVWGLWTRFYQAVLDFPATLGLRANTAHATGAKEEKNKFNFWTLFWSPVTQWYGSASVPDRWPFMACA